MNYSEFLESEYWKEVKETVKNRDNNKYLICGSLTNLHIHHISYKVNNANIIEKEKDFLEWLITVCEKHHLEIHSTKNHLLNPDSFFKINLMILKVCQKNEYNIN